MADLEGPQFLSERLLPVGGCPYVLLTLGEAWAYRQDVARVNEDRLRLQICHGNGPAMNRHHNRAVGTEGNFRQAGEGSGTGDGKAIGRYLDELRG